MVDVPVSPALDAALTRAADLVAGRQFGDARRALDAIVEVDAPVGQSPARFALLRLISQIDRQERRFDEARAKAREAYEIAVALKWPTGEAVMLESLALIESADGNTRDAYHHFLESARVERASGNLEAGAVALNNCAHMLIVQELEGAEPLLHQAIREAPEGSMTRAALLDNLGNELERQGRHVEAVEPCREAVERFRALDAQPSLFLALRHLTRHLAQAGRDEDAARTFDESWQLAIALGGNVDDQHYDAYPERVKAIEAASPLPAHETAARAKLADTDFDEGKWAVENGEYAKAVAAFERALAHSEALGAAHMIVRVDHHRSVGLSALGDHRAALELAVRVRDEAARLGDAATEAMALSSLFLLRDLLPAEDALERLARAVALNAYVARSRGVEPSDVDGGAQLTQLARLAMDAHAYGFAVGCCEASVEIVRGRKDLPFRLVQRLVATINARLKGDLPEGLPALREELRRVTMTRLADDPRGAFALAATEGLAAYASGSRSKETFEALVAMCDAYEDIRRGQRGASLEGLPSQLDPPFAEAADVALALGRPLDALRLLAFEKSRTLLEALRAAAAPAAVPDHGRVLELLVLQDRIEILVVEDDAVPTVRTVPDAGGHLKAAVVRLNDAADVERGLAGNLDAALTDLLAHETFGALCRALVAEAAGASGPMWLAPHRHLHNAPFQLAQEVVAGGEPVPWSIVPTSSAIEVLPRPRPRTPGSEGVTAIGDPDGTLPFAGAEAALVSPEHHAVGASATYEWLRDHCDRPELSVLHLACHGRFDAGHPERSGLVLAGAGPSGAALVGVDQVAALALEGVVVTLSACSSGLTAIREGDEATGLATAFLRAGAAAVVAAQWPIADLSAMLFMLVFHKRNDGNRSLVSALDLAGRSLSEMTVDEVVERGFEIAERLDEGLALSVVSECLRIALATTADRATWSVVERILESPGPGSLSALKAVRLQSSTERPFEHPRYWGAFAVIGHNTT